jgi:hypothetical protein
LTGALEQRNLPPAHGSTDIYSYFDSLGILPSNYLFPGNNGIGYQSQVYYDLRDLVSPYTDCSDLTERFGQQVNDSTTVHLESTDTYSVNNLYS